MRKIKILLFLCSFLVTIYGFGQENAIKKSIAEQKYTSDWQLYKTFDQVDIYFQYTTCEEIDCCELVLLKIVNNAENKLTIKWKYNLGWSEFINDPVTSSDIQSFEYDLSPNEVVSSDCNNLIQELHFFIRELSSPDVNVLTKFEIEQIEILN
jgi:hypothetical protein